MLLFLFSALAQSPIALGMGNDTVEIVYIADVASTIKAKRFLDEKEPTGPSFVGGKALRVLLRENGMVRVRVADDYGWLEESKLTGEKPAKREGVLPTL